MSDGHTLILRKLSFLKTFCKYLEFSSKINYISLLIFYISYHLIQILGDFPSLLGDHLNPSILSFVNIFFTIFTRVGPDIWFGRIPDIEIIRPIIQIFSLTLLESSGWISDNLVFYIKQNL